MKKKYFLLGMLAGHLIGSNVLLETRSDFVERVWHDPETGRHQPWSFRRWIISILA